jgi:hypothetical protein
MRAADGKNAYGAVEFDAVEGSALSPEGDELPCLDFPFYPFPYYIPRHKRPGRFHAGDRRLRPQDMYWPFYTFG